MADPGIINEVNAQGKDIVQNIQGLNKTGLGDQGAIAKKIEGVTEAQKSLQDSMSQLPQFLKDLLEKVGEVTEHVALSNKNADKERRDEDAASAKGANAEKTGGQTEWKATDVAGKIPAKYGAGSLMLEKTIRELFATEDSDFFKIIAKSMSGNKIKKPEETKADGGKMPPVTPIKGPKMNAAMGVLGIFAGVATTMAVTPFLKASLSMVAAKKFAKDAKMLIDGEDGHGNWKSENVAKFKVWITLFKDSTDALKAAGKNMASMGLVGTLGSFGVKVSHKFVAASIEFISETNRKAKDVKWLVFAAFCKSLEEAYKSIFYAALYASVAALFVLPGILGALLSKVFIKASLSLLDFKVKSKMLDLAIFVAFTKGLSEIYKSLMQAAFYATITVMFVLPGIMGALLSTIFIKATFKMIDQFEKGGKKANETLAIGVLIAVALKVFFKALVGAEFFAVIAGMLAIPALFCIFLIIPFLIGVKIMLKLLGQMKTPVLTQGLPAVLLLVVLYVAVALMLFIVNKFVTLAAIGKAILATLLIVGLMAVVALAGLAGGAAIPFIAMLALAAIAMSVAFVLVAVSLFLATFIIAYMEKTNVSSLGPKLALFLLSLGLAGLTALMMLPMLIPLLIVSAALVVVFITLTIALFLSQVVLGIMDVTPISDWFLMGVWLGALFLALSLAGIGALVLLPFIVVLTAVSVLLAATFIMLSIALFLSQVLLGIMDVTPIEDWFKLGVWLGALFVALIVSGVGALIFLPFAVVLTLASVLMLVIFASLVLALALAKVVAKEVRSLGDDGMKTLTEGLDAIFSIITLKTAAKAALIILKAGPVVLATIMMATIFGSVAAAYKSLKELGEYQEGVNVKGVFDAIDQLMDIMKNAADKLKATSKGTLEKIKIGLVPIVEAIASITDVVIKLSDPKFTGSDRIDNAINNLQEIIKRFFGLDQNGQRDEKAFNVLNVLDNKGFKKFDKKNLATIEALGPLMEALSSLVDVIQKVSDLKSEDGKPVDIPNAVKQLNLMSTLAMPALKDTAQAFFKGSNLTPKNMEDVNAVLSKMPQMIKGLVETNKLAIEADMTQTAMKFTTLISMIDNILVIAKKIKDKKGDLQDAHNLVNNQLSNLVKKLVQIGTETEKFVDLKDNITNNLIQPLLELSKPVQELDRLTGAVSKLNSELTKLMKENKETIKMVNSIGKTTPGQAVMGLVQGVGSAIGNAFGGDKSKDEMNSNVAAIKESVQKIEKSVAPKRESWVNVKAVG